MAASGTAVRFEGVEGVEDMQQLHTWRSRLSDGHWPAAAARAGQAGAHAPRGRTGP
jgi:hypothetical protein